MAYINSISFYSKYNYVNFSDTDISTDYFNSYSLQIKQTIDWLKKNEIGNVIKVDFINNRKDPKFYKRLDQIAKAINYKIKTVTHRGIYRVYENDFKCEINPYCYDDFLLYNPAMIKESDLK